MTGRQELAGRLVELILDQDSFESAVAIVVAALEPLPEEALLQMIRAVKLELSSRAGGLMVDPPASDRSELFH